ncbi:MAG: PAS domain-containing protein [Terriglobales bacterium]|jgi:PAS domain S-box-containing protein
MSGDTYIQPRSDGRRYEAVLRLGEALSLCTEPEDLTKILSEELREFLDFLQFYIVVYKEKSSDVEWAVVGREKSLMAAYADVPVEQRPSWQAYTAQEPFHIRDWNTDARVPTRLKQGIAAHGLDVGPLVFVPLTTPHRRLGALGMSGSPGTVYSNDDISFLRLIGRVVAFAIDDNFNLRRAEVAQRELQRQNELLQRSERELREVIESIPSMAWSAAPDGSADFFNERWLAYAGLTADQAQGWAWTVAVHPDDLNPLVEYWQKIMVSGQSGEIETRLRRFDGVYRWFLFRATASLDDNGRIVKWYGTNTDIEERKKAEQALRRSEAYLAEAQRLTLTGSCAVDGTSRDFLYWSEEMFRLFAFDQQHGLPRFDQWVQRIHPEDRDKFRMASEKTFLKKVDCDVEFRIVKPDGTVKHIHGIGHPVLSASGELIQVVGTMVDVTEHKRAEEARDRLRQLEADLAHISRVSTMGELTASLAHEIKQPIGAAVTNAEACFRLLDRDQPDLPEAKETALEMVRDARHAAEIIDRVRLLYQKGSPRLDIVDVNELIRDLVIVLNNEANRHSVTMHTDLAEELPGVMADRVQLQQALMNLMLNGIEAMRNTRGELSIKSQLSDDGQLLISIADTGVGLPTEKIDKIFNAFFTTKSQGTGLGLAITRSIVESHGGRIWATANSGRGATFSFTLPSRVAVAA